MFDHFENTYYQRPTGALQIKQHVQATEKRQALINYRSMIESTNSLTGAIGRVARRLGSMIGSLFM